MPEWHSLKAYNSLSLDAKAQQLRFLSNPNDIDVWLDEASNDNLPILLLGGGSNVVFTQNFAGSVGIVTLPGIEHVSSDDAYHYIAAGAGANWHELVEWTLANNFTGLENLSLIPGSAGAAPMQNIGAYGVELAQRFEALEAIELATGRARRFTCSECRFAYRDSRFKQEPDRWLITRITLKLPKQWRPALDYASLREALPSSHPDAQEIYNAVCRVRKSKLPDPKTTPNVGSFFKNPMVSHDQMERLKNAHPELPFWPTDTGYKLSAGWLIEQCGWKGKRRGSTGVHDRHALVLVNHGGATGAEVWRLALDIQDSVQQRYGITLEPEPRII